MGEETDFEIVKIPLTEFIVVDSDNVDSKTAFEIAKNLERFVISIPGGKANIQSIDRASLKTVLEATEPKKDEKL